MKKIEIAARAILIVIAIFFFLHSLKIISFVDSNTVGDLSGFSETGRQNSAMMAGILELLIMGLLTLFVIVTIVSLATKRKFEKAFSLIETAQKQFDNFSQSIESSTVKIFGALAFWIVASFLLFYLGIFKETVQAYSYGYSRVMPVEQMTFLFAGMLCLVYAVFPKKVSFKDKIKLGKL